VSEFRTLTDKQYYAYQAYEDEYGVIAPWYDGQNGQADFRVQIAVETLKRYPWTQPEEASMPAPHFLYNGRWNIDEEGTITIPEYNPAAKSNHGILRADWANGDLVPRATRSIFGMQEYYAYSGDPYAFGLVKMTADYLITNCRTASDHEWPGMIISAPTRGKMYGECDPHGFIQLDNSAACGLALVRAYKMTGDLTYLDTAIELARVFAERCNHDEGEDPWPRYANPEDVTWGQKENGNRMTGGVSYVITFLDELSKMSEVEDKVSILRAIDTGERYLRERLLPNWFDNPTWGYNYWDASGGFSNHNVVYWTSRYILSHKDRFPNWRSDVRRIMTIMLNRTSPNPTGENGVYSGSWVHTESSHCCRDTNGYGPQRTAGLFLQYADEADSEWAKELGRRMVILSSYDAKKTGMIIDGLVSHKPLVAKNWFKIAVLNPIVFFVRNMSWMPEHFAPNRENHLLRSSSVVRNIVYGDGIIEYETYDAPENCVDVLRLAFSPTLVTADGITLRQKNELDTNGYSIDVLSNGDAVVTIRRDGLKSVEIRGRDPQRTKSVSRKNETTDSAAFTFSGNQVRVIGDARPDGGKADVYLDGEKLRAPIDFWSPVKKAKQVMFSKNGILDGKHTLEIVAQGEANPHSEGTKIYPTCIQHSAAKGNAGFGSGGGPTGRQGFILGYPRQFDYVDSSANVWTSGTEVLCPRKARVDTVATHWWTTPQADSIDGTPDPELYRYGMHGEELKVYFTVGPATYKVRILLAETRTDSEAIGTMDIYINGEKKATSLDIADKAVNKALDLVFENVEPKNGVIEIVLTGNDGKEAIVQAIEISPS